MKYGLIVEGGGMKCAYGAAILDRFLDEKISFDYCIGISAGSANLASFLAGQRDRNRRYYVEHSDDPRYLSLRNYFKTGSLFGLDYIYSYMTNSDGPDPLDFPALQRDNTEYEIVTTDGATGKPVYLNKSHMVQDDYWAVKASCALPAACKPVKHDGFTFFDGGVSDSLPIERALEKGCDKVVVVMSKPKGYVKKPQGGRWFYKIACRKYPAIVNALDNRHIMYSRELNRLYELEKEGKVFLYMMSRDIDISVYTKDKAIIQSVYDLGLEDYETLRPELHRFLDIE